MFQLQRGITCHCVDKLRYLGTSEIAPAITEICVIITIPLVPPQIWEITPSSRRNTLRGHKEEIQRLEFSPADGTLLASADNTCLRLWDVETGLSLDLGPLNGDSGIGPVSFSPDGELLAAAISETVQVFNIRTGQRVQSLHSAPWDTMQTVAFAPRGNILFSKSHTPSLRAWKTPVQSSSSFTAGTLPRPMSFSSGFTGRALQQYPDDIQWSELQAVDVEGLEACLFSSHCSRIPN